MKNRKKTEKVKGSKKRTVNHKERIPERNRKWN